MMHKMQKFLEESKKKEQVEAIRDYGLGLTYPKIFHEVFHDALFENVQVHIPTKEEVEEGWKSLRELEQKWVNK